MLWLAEPVIFLIYYTMATSLAGKIEADTPLRVLMMTLVLVFPLIMAYGTLTLKDSINSWVNIIGGIMFAGGLIYGIYNEYNLGITFSFDNTFAWLLFFFMYASLALIIRYAWKSKQKA
jgi:hypothetical protein